MADIQINATGGDVYRTDLYTDQKRVDSYRLPAGGGRCGTVFSSREGGTNGNRSFAGRTADRPVVRIRGSITLRGSCYAYLRNGTLVFSSAVPPGSGAFQMPTCPSSSASAASASASTLRGFSNFFSFFA